MSSVDDIQRLLAEAPKYLSHITVSRIVLENILQDIKKLQDQLKDKESPK